MDQLKADTRGSLAHSAKTIQNRISETSSRPGKRERQSPQTVGMQRVNPNVPDKSLPPHPPSMNPRGKFFPFIETKSDDLYRPAGVDTPRQRFQRQTRPRLLRPRHKIGFEFIAVAVKKHRTQPTTTRDRERTHAKLPNQIAPRHPSTPTSRLGWRFPSLRQGLRFRPSAVLFP